MIIDSHQHFWKYHSDTHSWIDESMKVISKDFLPSDLKPILEKNHVDGCIAVQVEQTEKETEFLLNLAQENPFIKGVVGWVDLRASNVKEKLEYFLKNSLFKGVRHIVQTEPNDFMLQHDFQNGISQLAQFNLTYDILVYPHQLSNAVKLVEKFPDQRFILDHIAKPQISEGIEKEWRLNIDKLANHSNVYCKLSGMVTETQNFQWNINDFTPFLDVIINAFGIDKVLFGSDWPVCLTAAKYNEVLNIITEYFSTYNKYDLDKVMGLNANFFYNL